jgi:hypothetical protein
LLDRMGASYFAIELDRVGGLMTVPPFTSTY